MRLTTQEVKQIILAQEGVSLAVKRSAWFLFLHEVGRPDPQTGRPYTARRALQNVLRWMASQRARDMIIHLTPAELRIIKLLMEGLTLKQIALEVGTSFRAVKRNPRVIQAGGYWKIKFVDGCNIATNGYAKKSRAIAAWNRRPSDGVGELLDAAEQVLKFGSKVALIILPYRTEMEGLLFALTDLDAAVQIIQQGALRSLPTRKLSHIRHNIDCPEYK